ncbi:MAG: hypothetical protein KBS66_03005 [Eubacterium sp.]|nr:hypothetical protein [Candidatus Colimonas fimequi]
MKNKIITIVTSLVMVATLMAPVATYAQDNSEKPEGVMGSAVAKEYAQSADMQLMVASGQLSSYSNTTFKAKARGIDVSQWQGKINWKSMKANGVQFAIIRAGVTKSDGTTYKDYECDNNVKGCEANGIPYGFYFYSCATTTSKVDKEISAMKSYIKGTHPTYPVYYDLEDSKVAAKKSTFITNMAVKFCDSMNAAGYKGGVYASKSWWTSYLTSSKVDKYEKWVAQWPGSWSSSSRCSYTKSYGMWQFTDNGKVGTLKPLDLDFAYKVYSKDTPGYWDPETGLFMEELDPAQVEGGLIGEEGEIGDDDIVIGEDVVYVPAKDKWIVSGGNSYYLDEEGHKMSGGIHEINGALYYFTGSGYIYKGRWITSGSNKYYALASGKLCRNGTAKLSNYWYGFNSEGQMLKGWKNIGTKGYYFFSNGKSCLKTCVVKKKVRTRKGASTKYKRGITLKKNKTVYVIRTYGKWCQLSNGYWVQSKYLRVKKSFPYAVAIKPVVVPDETTEATAAEEETKTTPNEDETTKSTTTTSTTESGGEGGNTGADTGDQPAPDQPLN